MAGPTGVEKERFPAHYWRMAQKARTGLLEVTIVGRSAASWEWQVHSGPEILICGFESTRLAASFAGNDALFLILASGWNA
jgi:hypothetical protein